MTNMENASANATSKNAHAKKHIGEKKNKHTMTCACPPGVKLSNKEKCSVSKGNAI